MAKVGAKKPKKTERRRLAIVALIVLVVAVIGLVGWQTNQKSSTSLVSDPKALAADQASRPRLVIGNPDAAVTMIEYADFKCPQCNNYNQGAGKRIRENYVDTGRMNIEFRPFPVFGADAGQALYGAYCAQAQGRFEAYHDALFAHVWNNYLSTGNYDAIIDEILPRAVILDVAQLSAGVSRTEMAACLDDRRYEQDYQNTVLMAADDGIQGTPSFLIGGVKIVGNQPFEIYETLIEAELRK